MLRGKHLERRGWVAFCHCISGILDPNLTRFSILGGGLTKSVKDFVGLVSLPKSASSWRSSSVPMVLLNCTPVLEAPESLEQRPDSSAREN